MIWSVWCIWMYCVQVYRVNTWLGVFTGTKWMGHYNTTQVVNNGLAHTHTYSHSNAPHLEGDQRACCSSLWRSAVDLQTTALKVACNIRRYRTIGINITFSYLFQNELHFTHRCMNIASVVLYADCLPSFVHWVQPVKALWHSNSCWINKLILWWHIRMKLITIVLTNGYSRKWHRMLGDFRYTETLMFQYIKSPRYRQIWRVKD